MRDFIANWGEYPNMTACVSDMVNSKLQLIWTEYIHIYVVSSITFDQLILAFFYLFMESCVQFSFWPHSEYTKVLKTLIWWQFIWY